MVEVMVTSLMDEYYQSVIQIFKRKELFVLAVCGAACLLGIPCVMQVLIQTHRVKLKRLLVFSPSNCLFVFRWGSTSSS